uniref:Uncharacterized protein n=1 Tax=Timema monikensis TaxID=170555 RepID=A0A7R9E009_9NEOP|nr:unnamed protein product [Timema monikensis]
MHQKTISHLIVACLVAVAFAAPPLVKYGPNEVVPIVSQANIVNEDGSFQNRLCEAGIYSTCIPMRIIQSTDFSQIQISQYVPFFFSSYESGDGTKVQASGVLKSAGPKEEPAQEVQGAYTFLTPDGQVLELRYIANENGFQPQASFLPVAPPIPEEIVESLKYNAAHPEEDNLP